MLLGKKTIHKNKIAHIIFHKQYAYLIGAINYFFRHCTILFTSLKRSSYILAIHSVLTR